MRHKPVRDGPPVIGLYQQVVALRTTVAPRLSEVLDCTSEALDQVDRPALFDEAAEQHAMQHYEGPFFEACDPGGDRRVV